MVKLDLQDAYFSVPLHRESSKYVPFQCQGNLFKFRCQCFGFRPAPQISTKLLKVPIPFMRKIQIHLVIYVDDLFSIWGNPSRRYSNFRFAKLMICDKQRKALLEPKKVMKFLGFIINSESMTIYPEKGGKIITYCKKLLTTEQVTIREMTSLLVY